MLVYALSGAPEEGADFHRLCAFLRDGHPDWLDEQLYDQVGGRFANDPAVALADLAVRWALCALNEVRGFLTEGGARREAGALRVWLGFHESALSAAALQLAVHVMFDPAVRENWAGVEAKLTQLRSLAYRYHPDYQARILMVGARERNIPILPFVPHSRYWQFGWGCRARVFMESASNADGFLGSEWQRDKTMSKHLFQLLGMPTPPYAVLHDAGGLNAAIEQVGYPCVVKPIARGGGKGVTANIRTRETLGEAVAHAQSFSPDRLMLEAHVPGHDFRLMVVDGRFMAAFRREPSSIVGDGRRTALGLIAEVNATRSANLVKSRYLRSVAVDKVLSDNLGTQGVGLDDVLPVGRRVTLRSNANVSTGGISTDVTDQVHPVVRAMAEQLARTFDLATVGIDYLSLDISRTPEETGGVFIELNTFPSLDVCVAGGWAEDAVAGWVLGDGVGAIAARMTITAPELMERHRLAWEETKPGQGEGRVCGADIQIGNAIMHCPTDEPWGAVRAALRNRSLQQLHIVCTAEQIVRNGLPLDRFDEVIVDGTELPPQWRKVIDRCTIP